MKRKKPDDYGTFIEPASLTIQRILPGPIERVWAYLTESELRRQWLASGNMKLTVGASFELVWRNDELTSPPESGRLASVKNPARSVRLLKLISHANLLLPGRGLEKFPSN